ncbi:uncharacterized protein LOC113135009 isoform X2 [Mastacembelus armatus]|nr:uncharacterized protein LOC113135009 isoform X2 [Mastacembelus armatus]
MEESYETFEEELWPPRADPPPQKPVRQIHRPEMYATRKFKEEMAPVPQQQQAGAKTLPREPSFPRTTSLQKTLSIQNLTQTETPWENVTLNRCLFVVITILVLTSGLQRLHETLRGQGTAEEEEVRLTVRQSGTLRHRGQPPEPETSLWDVMFWWLPDLDDDDEEDEDEEDDDGQVKRGKLTKKATPRASRGFRNKPMPDKNLLKQRGGELKRRGAKKANNEKNKGNKERDKKDELEAEGDEDRVESDDEEAPRKSNKLEKKKTPKD